MSTALLDAVVKKNRVRLIPFMLALYVLAFLDRSNIGFAKQTYQIDTGLSNEAYALGAGIFFVVYAFLGVPANLLMRKLGARTWITWTKSSTSKGLMACLLDLRIFLRRWATRITPGTRKCSELLKPVFGGSVLRVKRLVFWLWLLIWRSNAWRGERTLSLLALTRCSTAMPWINDWRCLNQAKMGHA